LSQIAVRLDRIAEAGRRLVAPFIERCGRGQAIEAVVDLDRVELARIKFEPALLRQVLRVEDAFPMPVDPARAADADLRCHCRREPMSFARVAFTWESTQPPQCSALSSRRCWSAPSGSGSTISSHVRPANR